ncbi:hypothetical protein [Burkholderia sp. AU38729]|uniref:hypothetical protein n=1 Tax=Burkholderia sp. AU38729 TaxID=2879633 RepID=UPI001CF3E6FA|nr:hypothetical protein [Burkholderia sp. AU38729]MCA8066509.1 hypothetical protein [Burkholderia sp. AU38729]
MMGTSHSYLFRRCADGLIGVNIGRIDRSATESRIAFTNRYGPNCDALVAVNQETPSGNRVPVKMIGILKKTPIDQQK